MIKDVPTASKKLKVGQSTLWRWIREGRLPVVRLGRRVLIKDEALQNFIKQAEDASKQFLTKSNGQQ